MSTQIMLTLPDATYRRAVHLAQLTGRDVSVFLTDAIDISLQSLSSESGATPEKPIAELSDSEVITLAESTMNSTQDHRLSNLLDRQQAGTISIDERPELIALMQVYESGLLRKARALHEAVIRGLREPLDP